MALLVTAATKRLGLDQLWSDKHINCCPGMQLLCSLLPAAAPCVCSKRFRARWMVKKLFMFTGGLGLMLFVTEQYIQPTIDNSMRPLKEMVRSCCNIWLLMRLAPGVLLFQRP